MFFTPSHSLTLAVPFDTPRISRVPRRYGLIVGRDLTDYIFGACSHSRNTDVYQEPLSPSGGSVVHFDVGPDRSISIEQFLCSIKRDPSSFSSNRRAQKRQRSEFSSESQLISRAGLEETLLPALGDETPIDFSAQKADAEAQLEYHISDPKKDVQSRLKVRFSPSTGQNTRVRKVYKRKHKDLTSALIASELKPPASLQSPHKEDPLRGTSCHQTLSS